MKRWVEDRHSRRRRGATLLRLLLMVVIDMLGLLMPLRPVIAAVPLLSLPSVVVVHALWAIQRLWRLGVGPLRNVALFRQFLPVLSVQQPQEVLLVSFALNVLQRDLFVVRYIAEMTKTHIGVDAEPRCGNVLPGRRRTSPLGHAHEGRQFTYLVRLLVELL